MAQGDTFALPEQRAVFSQEVAAPLTPQTGLSGGNITGGIQVRTAPDAPGVLDNLIAFGLKLGDEKIMAWEAEQKDKKFMEGMQRAATGQASTEIAAQQPWWAKLFGDGNVVAGAKAWEGITDANQMEASVMERMLELRTLPAEKATAALMQVHKEMQTGDPTRDAAKNAMWLKALPGILKLHAKEHFAYQQEVAAEAQRKGIQSGFDAYSTKIQALNALDNIEPEDKAQAEAGLRALFTPPKNANKATYKAQIVEGLANSMAAGKFEAYSTASKLGLLGDLPPNQARQLEALHDREARKVALDRAPEHLKQALYSIGTLGSADTAKELDAINAEFMKVSGLDIPLVPTDKYQTLVMRAAAKEEAAAARALAKAERENDKAEAKAEKQAYEDAKTGSAIAAQQAMSDAADKLVAGMLDSPNPQSVPIGKAFNAGSPVLRMAQERLALEAARRWDEPPIDPSTKAAIDALPVDQQVVATQGVEAESRYKLLSKEGLDLSAVRADIGKALATGDYATGAKVIDALAFGAEGSGLKKLPANFVRLIPEVNRPQMAAYAAELGAVQPGPDGKLVVDRQAAWAAAEARTKFSAKGATTAKDINAIRTAIKDEFDGGWFGIGSDSDMNATQAGALLTSVATKLFDSRVTSAGLPPHAVAIAAAKEQIVVLRGSGVAYLDNPQAREPIEGRIDGNGQYVESSYIRRLPAADKHLLSSPDRLGKAIAAAAEAQGLAVDKSAMIYRGDDTPQGMPSFVVLDARPGHMAVVTLSDMLASARKLQPNPVRATGGQAPLMIPGP